MTFLFSLNKVVNKQKYGMNITQLEAFLITMED